jgi:hypothetical protein
MAIAVQYVPVLKDKIAKDFEEQINKNLKEKKSICFSKQISITEKILKKSRKSINLK